LSLNYHVFFQILSTPAGRQLSKDRHAYFHRKSIFDATVVVKYYSFEVDGVRRQYSGNAHGVVKGIGLVNMIYYNAESLLPDHWLSNL